MKRLFFALVLAGLGVGSFLWWRSRSASADPAGFREAVVERSDFQIMLAGSGTLEPEEVVDVGAQVAGIIREFGRVPGSAGHIDYGSIVEPGTVLARIDDAIYREEVELARADLIQADSRRLQAESGVHQAEANLQRSRADLEQLEARREQALRNKERTEQLYARNTIPAQDLEASQLAAVESATSVSIGLAAIRQTEAALETARAAVVGADAAVLRAKAVLRKAETNLGYTTIVSPIGGVIIDRRVNIGQTVVASLNAPSLFLIAKDLKRLQIWASVNEADIGSVRVGQNVSFTVDAIMDREFAGVVSQIRLNASMIQNVVTYTVVITVDNSDGRLMPYMTANLRFEVDVHKNVLLAPVGAVRWQPREDLIHPEVRRAWQADDANAAEPHDTGVVWVADGPFVRPVPVAVGSSDWTRIEISGRGVREGLRVVIGEARAAGIRPGTVNPFAPQLTPKS